MLSWLRRPRVQLAEPLASVVRTWRDCPPPDEDASPAQTRFVVVDTETTGLDPQRAEPLSIGACSVVSGAIDLSSSCHVGLRPSGSSETGNVLVHRIGHGAQSEGLPVAEAMAQWLAYAGRPVFVGFHARYDATILARAARRALGIDLPMDWLDVGLLLQAALPEVGPTHPDLDFWAGHFGIGTRARHSALEDAYVTATLFLAVLGLAAPAHRRSVRDLRALQRARLDRPRPDGGHFPGA
jgi:DNA polymerase-3 subunit epsilon